MSDQKKLSTAEILAAARKQDSKGSQDPTASAEAQAAPPPAAASQTPAKPAAAPKPAAGAGTGRPSVAEMMALARAEKAKAAEAASSPAPAAAEKPAPKPKADKPAKAEEPKAPAEPKETSSILAAARKTTKAGPMTKEEAAEKGIETKPKLVVPPMPAKPDYAKPKTKPAATDEDRRSIMGWLFGSCLALGFSSLSTAAGLWTLGLARFMFPNILTEPPSRFKVGFPTDFPPGKVEEKFKALFGVWIVNAEYNGQQQIVAIRTVCTHLGCTPNWLEGEQKFKCPCHGSGFYKDGINFEGPAPRPLERYSIRLADDGQIEVDKSKMFQEELGQWVDPGCFVAV